MSDRCMMRTGPLLNTAGRVSKSIALNASRFLGVNRCARWLTRSKLLILCYHGVVADDHPHDAYRYRNTISQRQFDTQMRLLAGLFHPITAHDLLRAVAGTDCLPPRAVLVTFDDGFRNNLTQAAPVLERYGIPAVFHVTTGYVGQRRRLWPQELLELVYHWPYKVIPMPGTHTDQPVPAESPARLALAGEIKNRCKQLAAEDLQPYLDRLRSAGAWPTRHGDNELYDFLTWDDVRSLHARGFAIGSHTVEHPVLTRLTPDRLADELQRSKATIERELGVACPLLAYPNGGREDLSPAVLAQVKATGYKAAFTLAQHVTTPNTNPYALSRISVPGHVPSYVFHSRISGLHSLLKRNDAQL